MPDFPYTNNIPAPNNTPAQDQPNMQTNTQSTAAIVNVDLYGFNDNNGGTHQQVTLPLNVTPPIPTSLASVVYTQPGTADSSKSQLFFQNSSAAFLLSSVKAFGYATASGLQNGYNVTSATRTGLGTYLITLSVTLPNTNYCVLASYSRAGFAQIAIQYTILSTNTFSILGWDVKNNVAIDFTNYSFAVLQV